MDYAFDEEMAQKVRTGILGLDVQLGRGVPRRNTIPLFTQQFAYGGLTEKGIELETTTRVL